jgi:hypothetical protein
VGYASHVGILLVTTLKARLIDRIASAVSRALAWDRLQRLGRLKSKGLLVVGNHTYGEGHLDNISIEAARAR